MQCGKCGLRMKIPSTANTSPDRPRSPDPRSLDDLLQEAAVYEDTAPGAPAPPPRPAPPHATTRVALPSRTANVPLPPVEPSPTAIPTPQPKGPRARLEAELQETETTIRLLRQSRRQMGRSAKDAQREAITLSAQANPNPNDGMGWSITGFWFFGIAGACAGSLLHSLSSGSANRTVSARAIQEADRAGASAKAMHKGVLSLGRELAGLRQRRFVLRRVAEPRGRVPRMINFLGIPMLCAIFLVGLLILAMVASFFNQILGLGLLLGSIVVMLRLWRRLFVPVARAMAEYPIWPRPPGAPTMEPAYVLFVAFVFCLCLVPSSVVLLGALHFIQD